ncbi:MAG: hypothetical protein K6T90_13280 [Leptolyngbyaceae cyanobacterium HOT.MB2.61]|nr:hypothetical protein [Leptolyngbyaceae cyanobacterium HOT.MB2.61]
MSQLTAQVSGCRSPLAVQRSPLNPPHCRVSWSAHRSPPQPRLTDRLLGAFAITDHPSLLPSPPTFWALSLPQITLKPLPQPTISWVLSG